MKIKRNGKQYDYDYMTMYVPGHIHRRLKKLAQDNKTTLVKMLNRVLVDFEKEK